VSGAGNGETSTRPELARLAHVELLDYDVVEGRAETPVVSGSFLFVHGFADDKTALRPLGDRLCGTGQPVLYPSLRAHGASPQPKWGYSPLDLAADLHRIVDAVPAPVHVVGYSFGALVAAMLAVTAGPSVVGSLAVLDQSFERDDGRYTPDDWAEASFLKWHYDYRHLFDALAATGTPALAVIARDSHVVPEPERERMARRRHAHFSHVTVKGNHREFLTTSVLGPLTEFYRHHVPNRGGETR
jgi:pimeloyl-ACP methyl ester carboxylesterase